MAKKSKKNTQTDLELLSEMLGTINVCITKDEGWEKQRKSFLKKGIAVQDKWNRRTASDRNNKLELQAMLRAFTAEDYKKANFHCEHLLKFLQKN